MSIYTCEHCGRTKSGRSVLCGDCGKAWTTHLADGRFRCVRPMESVGDLPFVEVLDESTSRRAALRFALLSTSEERRCSIGNEARLLRDFEGAGSCPGFIAAGLLRTTGQPYLAMEYIEGEGLSERRHRKGPTETAALLLRMAAVLEPLHAAGWVHGSLRPARFLSLPSGRLCLTHLADARAADSPGNGSGCPGYRPPEQRDKHRPVTPATDVWALAACGYLFLCGRHPSGLKETDRPGAPFTQPAELNPLVTPRLEEVLLRALDLAPENRYACATEFRGALHEVCGRATAVDPADPAFSPAWRAAFDDARQRLDALDRKSALFADGARDFLHWLDTPWRNL